jgi:D-serine deaminase-like pyridoxal phosphate-dependent protein
MRVPGLAVDAGVLERNLRAMADSAARRGLALRPHAKTHKCLEIARRQIELGAVGLSVATVGEAEVFADGGIGDLFIAYPVWAGDDRGGRLAALARRVQLTVGVDSAAGADRLAAALGRGTSVKVLVEVDCGLNRSGVRPAGAAAVATAAAGAGLTVAGVFTFPGHSYGPGAAVPAAKDEAAALAEAADAFAAAGLPCGVRSGGSTPSAALAEPPATEIRPGVYVFNDTQQVTMGSCLLGDVALAAVANVVSVPAADRFVLDTGTKILGADRPPWTPGHALLPGFGGWRIDRMWEHHAVATPDRDAAPGDVAAPPRVGDQVIVIPNHVCTVVNLADQLTVVRDGQVTGHWQVAARGRND